MKPHRHAIACAILALALFSCSGSAGPGDVDGLGGIVPDRAGGPPAAQDPAKAAYVNDAYRVTVGVPAACSVISRDDGFARFACGEEGNGTLSLFVDGPGAYDRYLQTAPDDSAVLAPFAAGGFDEAVKGVAADGDREYLTVVAARAVGGEGELVVLLKGTFKADSAFLDTLTLSCDPAWPLAWEGPARPEGGR